MVKLIAGFFLLGFIVLAAARFGEATCSWVLWSIYGTADPDEPTTDLSVKALPSKWQPSKAFNTAQECETATKEANIEERNILLFKRNKNKPKGAPWDVYLYRCLPDTVDPRGPKAGGR